MDQDQAKLRLAYLGVCRLLADTWPTASEERKDQIDRALTDMTKLTGVKWREDGDQILINE